MNIGLHDTQSYSGFKKSYGLQVKRLLVKKLQAKGLQVKKLQVAGNSRNLVTRNQKEKLQVTNQP
jgi:hypothetical protein